MRDIKYVIGTILCILALCLLLVLVAEHADAAGELPQSHISGVFTDAIQEFATAEKEAATRFCAQALQKTEPVKTTEVKETKETKEVKSEDSNKKKNVKKTSSSFKDSRISRERGVSDSQYKGVIKYYDMVPDSLRAAFEGQGYTVTIVSGDLGGRFGYASTSGVCSFPVKTIYIDNRAAAQSSVIHEMGHFADFISPLREGYNSSCKEFSDIYKAEKAAFVGIWKTNSANVATLQEYFAECFQCYVMSPKDLKKACPKTYSFIQEIIKSFE